MDVGIVWRRGREAAFSLRYHYQLISFEKWMYEGIVWRWGSEAAPRRWVKFRLMWVRGRGGASLLLGQEETSRFMSQWDLSRCWSISHVSKSTGLLKVPVIRDTVGNHPNYFVFTIVSWIAVPCFPNPLRLCQVSRARKRERHFTGAHSTPPFIGGAL